jgi:membrane-associated protease RseP (regulator of RpoE activity)
MIGANPHDSARSHQHCSVNIFMSNLDPPLSVPTTEYLPGEVYVVQSPKPRYWLHSLLFLATVFTTLVVGARMEYNFQQNSPAFTVGDEFIPLFPVAWVFAEPFRFLLGIPFSAPLLLILLAHEMGHYFCCRYYKVDATLPFFIPAPTLIGTLGAVIRIRSPIRSRNALFDIGIAGPIAGFVVAVATLLVALALSKPAPSGLGPSDLELGYPLIFHLVHWMMAAVAPIHPVAALPLDRVYLHPVAVASWVGMIATALNLLPSGQLDGGHIIYALWPRAHRYISWLTVLVLVILGQRYMGWRIWAALVAAMNIISWRQRQAPDFPEVHGARWVLAVVALAMLVTTFTRVPARVVAPTAVLMATSP